MYNNPYMYNNFPYQHTNLNGITKKGLFPSKVNWNNLLNNTQKTLNVINQAIPLYYQVKPIYNNAKTMFRMVSALKDDDKENLYQKDKDNKKNTSTGPVFYL